MENRRMGQAGGPVYYHKKRKLKKGVIYAIIALIIVIAAIFGGIRYYNLINSYPYKLEKAGYNDKEITTITKKLKDKEYFKNVKPCNETVIWENGEDVCPEDLYYNSKAIKK